VLQFLEGLRQPTLWLEKFFQGIPLQFFIIEIKVILFRSLTPDVKCFISSF
jgi:hypothetical protein